jgi:malate synthase
MSVSFEKSGVELLKGVFPENEWIVSPEAMLFVANLHRLFDSKRRKLLEARRERQARLDHGERPDFLSHTKDIRETEWEVAPLPSELLDRRVEITGPVDRKMIINGLNSGARVFMADFEDSNTPTWGNQIEGQINLADAVRRRISFVDQKTKKQYRLNESTALLFVRPRGWHLEERHIRVDGEFVSASIFDFALYCFHNANELLQRCSAPYFYLPKLESHLEARLWNEIFTYSERVLNIPVGTIRATVLIENILAAFEMHEILYELRDHSAGLNCGRWDYIFSFIKKFAQDAGAILPDRATLTMATPFLRSYSKLLIQTCHKRNVHAMGGMAAFIPIKDDPVVNQQALEQVCADKEREATDGHDGTWVAHPALVPIATEVFDRLMPGPNQIEKKLEGFRFTAKDLLTAPKGPITQKGLRQNIAVCLGYMEAWFRGIGCVPLFNLMEDAATAEISRSQLWQWIHHGAHLMEDGRLIDVDLCDLVTNEEAEQLLRSKPGTDPKNVERAVELIRNLIRSNEFVEFLTLPAYQEILKQEAEATGR